MDTTNGCCVNKPPHRCRCQQSIDECAASGIALQTDAPSVRPRLAERFATLEGQAGIFAAGGEGHLDRVEAFVAELSCMERRALNAVVVGPDGRIDPWSSAPVEKVLTRLRTPWLPRVLNEELLEFHMQPIVDAYTLEIFGFEALMRCSDRSLGVTPFDLITAAKAHDALLKLDQIARRGAILQCASKLRGEERLFVNFMPLTIYDPEVCLRTTFKAAEDTRLDSKRIVFEVVESEEFPDIEHLSSILNKYRESGYKVALDDLGAGNTSLTYVNQLNPDLIKIDREIISSAAANDEQCMLRGLVTHAKDRGITVLGEGVETPDELNMLREMGVDLIQGWLIAKPALEPVRDFSNKVPRLAA